MGSWKWDAAVAAELTGLFREWTDCVAGADPAALDPYLHEDFLYVTIFGLRLDKTGYLAMVEGLSRGGSFAIARTSARVRDDVAELDGEYDVSGRTSAGEDLSAHTRFTATWVRERERWRCLTHHGTRYAPDPS